MNKFKELKVGERVWCTNEEWEACKEWQRLHPTQYVTRDGKQRLGLGYVMAGFTEDGWWMFRHGNDHA